MRRISFDLLKKEKAFLSSRLVLEYDMTSIKL